MKLYDEAGAKTFATKADCQKWIRDRAVRFKLAVEPVELPNGETVLTQRKTDGRIVDITADGYKAGGLDEPLKRYAKPVRQGDRWMAVMLFDQ